MMNKELTQQAKQVKIYSNVFSKYRQKKYLSGWKKAYVERIFKDMPCKVGYHFLDIGTGSGFMVIEAAKRGMRTTGLDISPEAIKLCNKFAADELDSKSKKLVNFIVGDAEYLPFKSNTFDRITCIALLEHLQNDDKAIAEIGRVLKKGGKASICVPNSYHDTPFLLRLIMKRIDKHVGHLRDYSPSTLIKKFKKNGLYLKDLTYHGHLILAINSFMGMLFDDIPFYLNKFYWWIVDKDLKLKRNPKAFNFTLTLVKK